ncbi:MAG: hypothetical protein EOM20_16490, partial [Spartobacteria bacterium]|nr:hypothetical protein [Spartobacteria bacterium]
MQTRYKTNGIVLLGLCLLAAAATASARLDIEWARIWGAPVNDYGQGIDMSGGSTMIYVAGQTFGSFDGATAVSGVGDACMSAYLQDGTRSWTRIWGSSGTDNAKGVAVAPGSGDIYVVGYTDGSFGGQTNQGMVDAFCSKFDSTGALLWTRIWGSDKDDYAEAVVVGAGGKVYVAGWTYGAFDGQTNNGLSDIFVSCISETGDRDWSMIWGSTVQDECRDITLYPTVPEQVFVTGWTMGAFDGQPHFGLGDIFLSNIDVGIPMRAWSRIWGSSLDDQGACVTMDMPGYAVYVAGHTAGAIGTGQSNAGGADFVLSRLSIGGTMMWSKTWGSPEDDSAIAARCEMFSPSNSAVMVVGNTYGSFASQINPMPGHSAFAMSAINETGGMDSAYIWGSTSDDSAKAVVVDGACNVYVAGYTDGSFGGQTNHGLYDMALTRFSPAMPGDRFVAPGGAHIWPYDTWANAATTIHEAVMAAFTGDTVYISNGVYMLDAPIVLMEEVNLTGVNGPEVTIIDGDGSNRCVEINNTGSIVYGLTLRNGYDTTSGGGLQMTGGRVRRCAIKGCQATYGGGVYMSGGEVQNCLIANNDASMMGGGVYQGSGGFISSCTIAGNSSISQAGGMYASGGSVVNTIVDGNSAPTDANIYNSSTTPAIFDHCCSVPVMPGVANVTGPAQFVNPGGYDFTLVNASPCVDRGTNALWMDAETDLGGHPRIINSIVDMGSFEYMNVPTSFVVSAVQGGHGTILPTQAVVSAGGTVVFNIYPDIGYEVLDVLVNNQSIGPTNQYTFVNVMSNQILGATYTAQMFNIISTSAVNGVITPPTAIVPYGGGETFLISPNPGFVIADVFVDGFSVGITSNYTFTNVTDDRTIAALFSTNVPTYTIAASTTPGGTILPPSALVTAGNSQSFSIIPDAGYHIVDVFVDSTAIGAVTSYTFNSVYSDHSIAASFSTNMTGYHISTIAGANGQISPIEANVPPGGSQNFTIEPDPGYVIRGVRVNGVFIGQTNTYLFTDVNSNQLIAASFIAATTTYEIAAAAGAHGRVNPSNAVVTAGGSHTVTITPDAGFFVRDVTVDGSSVGAVPYFVFDDVFDNHHLFASFDTTGPGSLSGQVVAGAMVLSNAHVELRNSANVTVYDAFTDHAGHYSITGINPGGYRVKAGHAAYADVWYDGGSGSHYIASAAVYQIFGGMTSQSLDFSLAPGQSPALVDVWSSPTGLPVYLDFLSTGLVTPAVVALGEANGIEHTVWVKGDGLPWPAPVGVAGIEAETERVDFTLASSPVGYLEVTTSPDGAEVYLDHTDAPAGVTPCGPFALAPGTH